MNRPGTRAVLSGNEHLFPEHFERGFDISRFLYCRPLLLSLYEGLGFRPCGSVFEQPGFGIMVPLVFIFSDLAHLRVEDATAAGRIQALLNESPPAETSGALGGLSRAEIFGLLSQPCGRTAFEGLQGERNLQRLHPSRADLAAKFLLNLAKSLALGLLCRP